MHLDGPVRAPRGIAFHQVVVAGAVAAHVDVVGAGIPCAVVVDEVAAHRDVVEAVDLAADLDAVEVLHAAVVPDLVLLDQVVSGTLPERDAATLVVVHLAAVDLAVGRTHRTLDPEGPRPVAVVDVEVQQADIARVADDRDAEAW